VIGRRWRFPSCAVLAFLPFIVPDHQQIQRSGLVAHDRRRGHGDEYFAVNMRWGIDMAKDDLMASSRVDGRG